MNTRLSGPNYFDTIDLNGKNPSEIRGALKFDGSLLGRSFHMKFADGNNLRNPWYDSDYIHA